MPAVFVVLDNGGGGIFSFLPQASELDEAIFEQALRHAAEDRRRRSRPGRRVRHDRGRLRAEVPGQLDAALAHAVRRGPTVVVVRTDRKANVALHTELESRGRPRPRVSMAGRHLRCAGLFAYRRGIVARSCRMPTLSEDLAFRDLVHQVSDDALWNLLDTGATTAYAGFDPTSDSLHVGNLLGILTLRRLQLAGHRPILLAGGGTGLIGDPGGKSDERPLLSAEQLAANVEAIRAQLGRFLDLSPAAGEARGLLLDNSEWLCAYGFIDFLRDIGKHFTVNQMIAKESVRSRIERPEQGISYTEFSYMLLQAYDYLYLHDTYGCRLQLGGSDQWGNITMGLELIRKVRGDEAFALTWPLLLRADGTKYGKSESGAIWLDAAQVVALQALPVLHPQARRRGGPAVALFHVPVARGDRGARRRDRGPTRATRGPDGPCPGGLHDRPRPG